MAILASTRWKIRMWSRIFILIGVNYPIYARMSETIWKYRYVFQLYISFRSAFSAQKWKGPVATQAPEALAW